MQNLPVILSVFAAAALIVAVLFWRLKPQATGDVEALNRRASEESEKARTLQTKLDEMQDTWRVAEANAAAAKATLAGCDARAAAAEQATVLVRREQSVLQEKLNQVQPSVAKALAEKEASDGARMELSGRYETLLQRSNVLQHDYGQALERAGAAEKKTASAEATAEAMVSRAAAAEKRVEAATADYDVLQTRLNDVRPVAAKASAEKDAAEEAKRGVEKRLQELSQKHDALLADHTLAVEQASAHKADAEHLKTQIDGMARTLESYEMSLNEDRAKLNAALATQQSGEDAVRQFETISQAVLKDVMGEAKREVSELAATIQKTSGEELSKHADKVARTLEPLQSRLEAYDRSIKSMEEVSHKTFGGLTNQISELQRAEQSLHTQAKALTAALSDSPKMRGNYGELTLKRLVEHAGMEERCHFEAQASRDTEDGKKIPDMVFSLPGGQKVVVDAKAVLNACTEAYEVEEESQRKILLKKHCENIKSRVSELSAKNYFVNHSDSVESVLLFLPAENLYIAAMMTDPGLTDYAAARKVTICGPNSLMLLLRVANQLWSRASIEKEAQDIKKCGEDIYNAACNFVEKFSGIGKKIGDLEAEYNGAMATFEARLLPAGKRMSSFEAVARNKEMGDLTPVKDNVRDFRETTKRLVAPTLKLPDLMIGDETGELVFAGGEDK